MVSLMRSMQQLRAVDGRKTEVPPMVDLAFSLDGELLPRAYAFPLYEALKQALPWLVEEPLFGVHAVRAPLTDQGWVLSHRARLTLRLPASRVNAAQALTGQVLDPGSGPLRVGRGTPRPIMAFNTLKAALVLSGSGAGDVRENSESAAEVSEERFMAHIERLLESLGIAAELVCGRPGLIDADGGQLAGFGLALHGLSKPDSVRLQALGLGDGRQIGCGLFLPHKAIEGLDAYPE